MSSNLHTREAPNPVHYKVKWSVLLADKPNNLTDQALQPQTAEPRKSHGDKVFDRRVYAGLNGIGTFIVTVPLGLWAAHGNEGGLLTPLKWAGEKLGKIMPKEYAGEVVMMLATSLGGWAMVIPTWIAEHHRKKIVDNLNKGTPDEHAPKLEMPKQTFGSLVRGRFLAMATVTVSFWSAERLFKKPYEGFKKSVANKVVKFSDQLFKTGAENKWARWVGEIGAIDVFATTAATTLLYVGSRFFARSREKHHSDVSPKYVAYGPLTMPADAPDTAHAADAPATTISGDKLHPGLVQEQAQQAAQLS